MIFNHFFFRENRRSFLLFRCWQNSGVSGSLVTISSYFSPGMFPEADFRYTTFLGGPRYLGLVRTKMQKLFENEIDLSFSDRFFSRLIFIRTRCGVSWRFVAAALLCRRPL